MRHLERALEAWARVPEVATLTGTDPIEIVRQAADAGLRAGSVDRVLSLLDEALAEPDPPAPVERHALLLERRARALRDLGRETESLAVLRSAQDLLPAEPVTPALAIVLTSLANSLMRLSDLPAAETTAERAVDVAAAAGSHVEEAEALITLGRARLPGQHRRRARRHPRRAALAEQIDATDTRLRGHVNHSDLLEMLGRHDEAVDAARAGLELAQRVGSSTPPAQGFAAATAAERLRLADAGAVAAWQVAGESWRAAGEPYPLAYCLFRLAEAQCAVNARATPQRLAVWKIWTWGCVKCVLHGAVTMHPQQVAAAEYVPRLAESRLHALLEELPAVMVTGPRAVGKTTTARRFAAEVLRLDRPAVAASVRADPDAALRRAVEPVLLDEWQEVPEVLGAVKRSVDDDPRPGRFLLTGSVEADLTQRMWPGTGRIVQVVLHGLTVRETSRSGGLGLIDLALAGDLGRLRLHAVPDIDGYVELALRSGFPEAALRLGPLGRQKWLDAYLDHVVSRDVRAAGQARDPVRLRRYLEVLGLSTAGLPADATLYQAAGIDQRTANAYDGLLESLYLVGGVPAWSSNRIVRLLKRAKRYVLDPALAVSAARIDPAEILRDGGLLGRVLDTFVAAQLRSEVALLPRSRMYHLRTESGRQEVDLIVDLGGGRVMGMEIKAGAAPGARDARHLAWLRDELGEQFVRGIVLNTGPTPFELGDRLWALPICALWAETH